ncbi:2-C-methyl-D-erythritol 2,4-cyclodiphosphate synthase [Nevskia soli]|jgi:2-C-methyl-D-erythritol 2,4-cyclodiphosphate synthase|uniref:2-C-methyl-D-erythritol 2,4-cyclodiphosphate synthase n=1 Tax=Nevskia soli TaxID=418856 RepID=UPI0015D8685E|nr:2-C-methyl-D-erythritol 2,4-cyclodiphosphate synthase [Nevskia soli]
MTKYRSGLGWDSHRLVAGKPLILGGVKIPSEMGLEGHSDADILSHAITDAILGAAGLGDIGMHFPDTDPEWKDADSRKFLARAEKLACDAGFMVVNVDATVILETPKLSGHRDAIRKSLAECLKLEVNNCSVKFKTAEKVGPVGEGKSAEAQAIVLLTSKY